ncbi:MAG TPA: WG repeat-containing protein, partial [Thermoanaerobaculia bacterium]|nr:WG repeat-containing protein [Thermoanaerobaculia bacterium]
MRLSRRRATPVVPVAILFLAFLTGLAACDVAPGGGRAQGTDATGGGGGEGLFPVRREGKVGFIDGEGRTVVDPTFAYSLEPSEGLIGVATFVDRAWGYLDATSREMVIAPRFASAGPSADGRAAVAIDDLAGYVDTTGEVVVAPRFASTRDFSQRLAGATLGDGWGFVDRTGEWAIEPRFDEL